MRAAFVRGATFFSYTPLLGLAAVVGFGKLVAYAALMDVAEYGTLGKMMLVSTAFGIVGSLGMQSVASRDLPALLARGRDRRAARLLLQAGFVLTGTCTALVVGALAGVPVFGLSAAELALGLLHGWSQSLFLTWLYESRGRLQLWSYASEMASRGLVVAAAGIAAGALGGGPRGILLAEFALTLAALPFTIPAVLSRARLRGAWVLRLCINGLRRLPWRAALLLQGGVLVSFVSLNLDRWLAAEHLGRRDFGDYSFAWLALVAAQSAQALLNSGVQPLLARHRARSMHARALWLTSLLSTSLLVCSLVLCIPLVRLLPSLVDFALPDYGGSQQLFLPIFLAAALRLSDFWTVMLLVSGREGFVLGSQLLALAVVAIGYLVWLAALGHVPTPASLAWLAFLAALLSHAAAAVGMLLLSRSRI
jgi:O-antigen/teichoic acid export membrane protein